MEFFISALGKRYSPLNLLVMLAGTFVGIAAGAMPGLSSVMALTIMTPLHLSRRKFWLPDAAGNILWQYLWRFDYGDSD